MRILRQLRNLLSGIRTIFAPDDTAFLLATKLNCEMYCYTKGQFYDCINNMNINYNDLLADNRFTSDIIEKIKKKLDFDLYHDIYQITGINQPKGRYIIFIKKPEQQAGLINTISHLLDKAPFYAWIKSDTLGLNYYNELYTKHLSAQKDRIHTSDVCGFRTVKTRDGAHFQVTENICANELKVGYALDITSNHNLHAKLHDNVKATYRFFDASYSAIAIYSAEKKLTFHNSAFTAMWKLDPAWLETKPHYSDILEIMRSKRTLPEQVSFLTFKQQQLSLFSISLDIPHTDFWHLPDGRSIYLFVIPYAEGAVLFSYTDNTQQLEIERAYKTLVLVRKETIENIQESVSVFAENGKLKLYNKHYAKLWDLEESFLDTEPTMRELMATTKDKCSLNVWDELNRMSMAQLCDRIPSTVRVELLNGKILDVCATPLRDGCALFTYSDITDSINLERSLRAINTNIMENDKFKTEFFENIAYELRSPLTSIYGYSEMLHKYYRDNMSEIQLRYLHHITQEARKLMFLINDMLSAALVNQNIRQPCHKVNLRQTLEETISNKKNNPHNDHIEVEMVYECTEIPHVLIDDELLKSIISKIIDISYLDQKCKLQITLTIDKQGLPVINFSHVSLASPLHMQRNELELCIVKKLANTSYSHLYINVINNQYRGARLEFTDMAVDKLILSA